jgi:glycosyltransferase involved in cell wall biosynthesis
MRIGLLSTDNREHDRDYAALEPRFGAAPAALLQGFATMPDIQVHVISCLQQPVRSPEKIADNIWYHSLHVPKIGWMRTLYQGCIRATRKKLREIRPDIVHGQGTERDCAMRAVLSGFPNVLTIHGNMAELARLFRARIGSFHWLAARLENFALARTAGVFCNSAYTENLVRPRARETWRVPNALRREFFETPPESLSENPNPGGTGHWPVLEGYQPAGAFGGKLPPKTGQWPVPPNFQTGSEAQNDSRCVLLNVGVVSKRKRQLELLQVVENLHGQGLKFEFQFIGLAEPSEPYAAEFLEKIKPLAAAGCARWTGELPVDQIIRHFDAAGALVHFPSEEAFGLVVAEAMARGLKFFGARIGGIADIAGDIPGAGLFEGNDWPGLTAALGDWIKNGGQRSAGAAALMRERYHPDVVARRHLEIYQEVLESNS